MRERASARLVELVVRLAMVDSSRFCPAPSVARVALTFFSTASTLVIVVAALVASVTSSAVVVSLVPSTPLLVSVTVSEALVATETVTSVPDVLLNSVTPLNFVLVRMLSICACSSSTSASI